MASEATAFPRGNLIKRNNTKGKDNGSKSRSSLRGDKSLRSDRKRSASPSSDRDFLFGKPAPLRKNKKRKKASDSKKNIDASSSSLSLLPLGGGFVVTNKSKDLVIESISFQKLAKGTKLLGTVREVLDDYALVSLPNLLTGYILKSEDDPSLQKALRSGQVMAFHVLKTASETVGKGKKQVTRRRIQLSMEPHHLNALATIADSAALADAMPLRGRITSIEDHGVMVSLGHGRRGFCNFDGIEGEYVIDNEANDDSDKERHYLHQGRVLDFLLKDNSASVWSLTLPSQEKLAHRTLPSSCRPPLHSLLPGCLVHCKVDSTARNGLCVSFLGNAFRGAIHVNQLGGYWVPTIRQESDDWKKVFQDQPHLLPARIIAVDAKTRMIRLTMQPHLLNLQPFPTSNLFSVGTVVEDAAVIRVDPGVGALLSLPINDATDSEETASEIMCKALSKNESYIEAMRIRTAYVHISKAKSSTGRLSEHDFNKEFAPSTKHKLRILSTAHWTEGVLSAATATDVVDAHVLTYNDLEVGKIYRKVPVCENLSGGSVMVDFGMGVRGLIPVMHLFDQTVTSDYRARLTKEKYSLGRKVNVRVLSVNNTTKRCVVTAKKSLLKDKDEPVTTFDGLRLGRRATGYVSRFDNQSLYVTFCNNVYGRVTARSLAAELGIENHRENYKLGDVVRCRVISRRKRMGKNLKEYTDGHDEQGDDEKDKDETSRKLRGYWDINLSLLVDDDAKEQDAVDGEGEDRVSTYSKIRLETGAILPAKSMKIVGLVNSKERERTGGFNPGYAVVRIKSKHLIGEDAKNYPMEYFECKLPFDQLADSFKGRTVSSKEKMDEFARKQLIIGETLEQAGIILADPKKSGDEYASAIGRMPTVSLRPRFIAAMEAISQETKILLPSANTNLFMGAVIIGYVVHKDNRHGAFVRFLDNLSGLVPKLGRGLALKLYETVVCKVVALDVISQPPKILLKKISDSHPSEPTEPVDLKAGDKIEAAEVTNVNFLRANLKLRGEKFAACRSSIRARLHVTMAGGVPLDISTVKRTKASTHEHNINKFHIFRGWKKGKVLKDLTCLSVDERMGVTYVELTTTSQSMDVDDEMPSLTLQKSSQLQLGDRVKGVVAGYGKNNSGLWLLLSPGVSAFIPALELSEDPKHLNNMKEYFPTGSVLACRVLSKKDRLKKKHLRRPKLALVDQMNKKGDNEVAFLSVLHANRQPDDKKVAGSAGTLQSVVPHSGDLVVGQIRNSLRLVQPPALMLKLRGGFLGRCCITELAEPQRWVNMPLGRQPKEEKKEGEQSTGNGKMTKGQGKTGRLKVEKETKKGSTDKKKQDDEMEDEEEDDSEEMEEDDNDEEDEEETGGDGNDRVNDDFPDGKYVKCRVFGASERLVDVSLRRSRIRGDLEDDKTPKAKEIAQAFVVQTNKKGCFVRLTRKVEGRVILKELVDGFLHDPAASFPAGRLVVGKVKQAQENDEKKLAKHKIHSLVDLDLRQSALLGNKQKLEFDDVELGSKHKATVTKIEGYGVFVRLANSKVSGLVHKSECSDKYIKKELSDLFDPGDLVKVLVIKKNKEDKKIGFSMKASHFEDDEDSDDDDDEEDESSIEDEEMEADGDEHGGLDDDEMNEDDVSGDLDSEDENFVSKLAAKKQAEMDEDETDDDDDVEMEDSDSDDDDDDEDDDDDDATKSKLDTDVGFEWGAGASKSKAKSGNDEDDDSSDDSDEEEEEEDDEHVAGTKSTHSSRKRAAARRREEQEISKRERALADGTIDENPETSADFERLLASEPNCSEHWIRYMAFYLSLADVENARRVARRAFDRIDFRQEDEKLNVWTALLTMELKFGTAATANTKSSFEETIDKACQHNNPKHVYLRVCEMLEKEVGKVLASEEPAASSRADAMFTKMCKKFRSKKSVWIAHLSYLVRRKRPAQDVLKQALLSLPEYKHVETMSKFAQLEFEYGNVERGRTIMDGILAKHPKRLDILFVYIDKEVKAGGMDAARGLLERKTSDVKQKFSDKQMKSLFKKWYRLEETHGTEDHRERVKDAARAFVERNSD